MNKRLNRIADLLEKLAFAIINWFAWGLELFGIDLGFGQAKYRKHGPRPRKVVRNIYNRTIVIREPMERVYTVRARQ